MKWEVQPHQAVCTKSAEEETADVCSSCRFIPTQSHTLWFGLLVKSCCYYCTKRKLELLNVYTQTHIYTTNKATEQYIYIYIYIFHEPCGSYMHFTDVSWCSLKTHTIITEEKNEILKLAKCRLPVRKKLEFIRVGRNIVYHCEPLRHKYIP